MVRFLYSKWDGSQEDNPDASQIMDELGKQLFRHGDLAQALRAMQRWGFNGQNHKMPSLEEMLERLQRMRQDRLKQFNLDSVMDDIKEKLDNILDTERKGMQKKLDNARNKAEKEPAGLDPEVQERLLKHLEEMAASNQAKLDKLPPDVPGRIKELNKYDFMDEEAKKQFQELMDLLKKQAMEQFGKNFLQNMKNLDPNALSAIKQMLQGLNQMLEQQLKGETPDFEGFMKQFGGFFGDNPPRNLEELMQNLEEQFARAQSLLDSLSPEAREELQELMDSMLDDTTKKELARMASNLERLSPGFMRPKRYPFSGDDAISYEEAMKLMENLQKMDQLERQMKDSRYDTTLDGINEELLENVMGEEARKELETIREITRLLEEAGYLKRDGDRFELTPKGIRKIGQQALDNIFSHLKKDRSGSHNNKRTGLGHETIEETKKYQFGDDFNLHVQKTVMNSLMREAAVPVKLDVQDFEVMKTEESTRSATVLMLDQSLSMFMNGYFEAAKQVAVALDNLIKTRYPKDILHVVTFSRRATEISGKELLLTSSGQRGQGTNYQSALRLARKLLTDQKCNNKEIILISDGEPTAHYERDQLYFQYPPSWRTIQMTLREVRACTAQRIVINTFLFDNSPFITAFVTAMARMNKGRVFFTDPDNLGKYVLKDYLSNKHQSFG